MTGAARIIGLDGKSYPAGPLPAADRGQLVGHVHCLAHVGHLSVRQIQASLEREHATAARSAGYPASSVNGAATTVQVIQMSAPEHLDSVSIHGGLGATRRCAAVVELLARVEHACGSCRMSPGLAASRVTWSRGCGL